jgi:hypothetical protein
MWLVETGTSADPRDTQVVCDCERSLSLEQAFQRGRLGRCHGERPWLGDRDPNGCHVFLRLLTRTATNTYFPQAAAVISLPSAEDVLSALVVGMRRAACSIFRIPNLHPRHRWISMR